MKLRKPIQTILFFVLPFCGLNAQEATRQNLDSVVVASSRIDLPFKENARTLSVITTKDIKESAATNVADLLQQVAGVDIRRRGINGMQADLYIRGGSFDQTLLLIDGMKMDDAQTGHHTMNAALPLEIIERIELVKGPAARVFGQNAFTGAINIVTKKNTKDLNRVGFQLGSYKQQNAQATTGISLNKSVHIAHASVNTSDGYRYNTDFNNQNYFLKSRFNLQHLPIDFIANFQERKFGANGFYASPAAADQYEETQTSLIGFSTVYKTKKLTLKPRVYWRRNQDEYLFVRQNPAVYRNVHITNKWSAEMHAAYTSRWGTTGFGVDLTQIYLSSNNLGDHHRFMTNVFAEHQMKFLNNKLDITPGVAVTYFSDFKFHAFPGVDIGYALSNRLKLYGNAGYTYRIPTYTDLYYSDPTTLGNEALNPEEAIAQEIGITYSGKNITATMALFNRDSKKLIDYVKENEADLWEATNIRNLNTKGFEVNTRYAFRLFDYPQSVSMGYSFIEDEVKKLAVNFSRYSINSLKHQATLTLHTQLVKNITHTVAYRYAERTSGNAYAIFDASLRAKIHDLEISVIANNLFNKSYYETHLVPMPKGNIVLGTTYQF